MRSASARDSGTVGYSTAHRAMPTVSGTAYSISERFADGLGNGFPERLDAPRALARSCPHGDRHIPLRHARYGDRSERTSAPWS